MAAARVDYVVAIDWEKDTLFPERILLIDPLDYGRSVNVTVGKRSALETEWHVPRNYVHAFLSSDNFKKLSLPTASGREAVLGTNDPKAWKLFNDLNVQIEFLERVPYRPDTDIIVRSYILYIYVKGKKTFDRAADYADKESVESKGRWKRIDNRLSSDE